jgi:nucleoside triphosphate diphosphatase
MDDHPYPDSQLVSRHPGLSGLARIRAVMHRLRAPGGCPWDAEQTHASLVSNLLEETYEVVDAIRREDFAHLQEELGDLLLQVVFHSELAEEAGRFDLDEVAQGIADKLVRRHPHVFGDSSASDSEAVLRQWDAIKRVEKGHQLEGFLHGVGDGLPALMRAAKLQKKAAKIGFDWPDAPSVLAKVREETDEVAAEYDASPPDPVRLAEEIGDLLFTVVNLARKQGFDPEAVLAAANNRFTGRFHRMEQDLAKAGTDLSQAGTASLENAWRRAK